jgi:hypothetical protein
MARQSVRSTVGRRQASRAADAVAKLPANSVAPAITGTPTEGETLTVSNGTWSNTPDAYAYIWRRDGVVIAGADEATYELTEDDVGAVITATVKATNLGVSAVATSAATDEIAAAE